MPAKRLKASATVIRSGSANGSADTAAKTQEFRSRPTSAACARIAAAVGHQRLVGLARAVPFDEREFRVVQRAALAVAEHLCELDEAALAGRQKLLAGEFRRGAQIKRRAGAAVRGGKRRGEGMQMGLVSGRNLQDAGLDFDEIAGGKPCPQPGHDPVSRQKKRPPVGMNVRGPKGGSGGQAVRHVLLRAHLEEICGDRAQDRYGAPQITPAKAKTSR